jgi:hypothetical protein
LGARQPGRFGHERIEPAGVMGSFTHVDHARSVDD